MICRKQYIGRLPTVFFRIVIASEIQEPEVLSQLFQALLAKMHLPKTGIGAFTRGLISNHTMLTVIYTKQMVTSRILHTKGSYTLW